MVSFIVAAVVVGGVGIQVGQSLKMFKQSVVSFSMRTGAGVFFLQHCVSFDILSSTFEK